MLPPFLSNKNWKLLSTLDKTSIPLQELEITVAVVKDSNQS